MSGASTGDDPMNLTTAAAAKSQSAGPRTEDLPMDDISPPTPSRDPTNDEDEMEEAVKTDMTTLIVRSVARCVNPVLRRLEAMDEHFRDLKAASYRQEPRGSDDGEVNDADDEGDDSPARKVRAKMTQSEKDFHRSFRGFLVGPKVRLCTSPEPTDLPNVKLVEAYCSDSSNPGPSLPDPAILWTHPMSHPWNETIIDMIADAFLTCLRADESTEPQFLKPAFVRTALIAKLKPIGVKLRKQLPRPLGPVESAEEMQSRLQTEQETMKKAKRRRERRSNNFKRRHERLLQLLVATGQPSGCWSAVLAILNMLGEDGVSSDETDSPGSYTTPRTLRRVGKPWISPVVASLIRRIDVTRIPMRLRPGPPPIYRHYEAAPIVHDPQSHTMKAVRGLPRNFYCDMWFRGLSPLEKKRLNVKKEMDLPVFPEISASRD